MNNTLKKIARRIRVGAQQKKIPLCQILVNIRSHDSYWSVTFTHRDLVEACNDKGLHREFGIRNNIIQLYQERCFTPCFRKNHFGHRTYEIEGKFYSYDPTEEMPF